MLYIFLIIYCASIAQGVFNIVDKKSWKESICISIIFVLSIVGVIISRNI